MVIPRTADNSAGAQSEWISAEYYRMMRIDPDKGILYTGDIIKSGINKGSALEIGPGPGYLGLEWLSNSNLSEYRITSNPFSIFIKGINN